MNRRAVCRTGPAARFLAAVCALGFAGGACLAASQPGSGADSKKAEEARFPDETWAVRKPEAVGLDGAVLDEVARYLGGRGCVVRRGYLVYGWGDYTRRGDVASAVKPWYSTFLFKAVEEGRLSSLDTRVAVYVPGLATLNGGKDEAMTFAHMANQISCYGVAEAPGKAFDYNDWQMALFADTLFLDVYGADSWAAVDEEVLRSRLTGILQCEDAPTFLAFGLDDRPGRLAVSPRDFARFGLMYLNGGRWRGRQVIAPEHVKQATRSPLAAELPRTAGVCAQMLPGQRSIGSREIPDNQTGHHGSYSWLWWVNGVKRDGKRYWPDAPADVFAALGHANGMRGMAVLPGLELVIAWNDTTLGGRPSEPPPVNAVFRLLVKAAGM